MRPTIGESDTESVFQSTPDQSGDEDIARVPETVVVEDVLEDVEVTRGSQAAFLSLDSVDLTVMFKTRANVMRSLPKFLRGTYKSSSGFARVGSWGSRPERRTEVQSMEVVRLVARNALIQTTTRRFGGKEQNGGEGQVLQRWSVGLPSVAQS